MPAFAKFSLSYTRESQLFMSLQARLPHWTRGSSTTQREQSAERDVSRSGSQKGPETVKLFDDGSIL